MGQVGPVATIHENEAMTGLLPQKEPPQPFFGAAVCFL